MIKESEIGYIYAKPRSVHFALVSPCSRALTVAKANFFFLSYVGGGNPQLTKNASIFFCETE